MAKKRKARIEHDAVVRRFADRLRGLRAERGMTQAELAARAKVTATYVSKLEGGGAAPGIDLVVKLAAALGIGVTDLLPDTAPGDQLAVSRERARELFEDVLGVADQQTFALLNPFLGLLIESSSKRR
jgi:transcriptional regulator with XRE-family HTH domain